MQGRCTTELDAVRVKWLLVVKRIGTKKLLWCHLFYQNPSTEIESIKSVESERWSVVFIYSYIQGQMYVVCC